MIDGRPNDVQAEVRGLVAGVDEAGRGPWAGPVVAAAVIFGRRVPEGLADSKRLSPARREQLFHDIFDCALGVAYRAVSPRCIDGSDILRATLKAMRESVLALPVAPTMVYVDGRQVIPGLPLPQKAFVGGDDMFPAVSAAGIVAKVIRDRMMRVSDQLYPHYGFARHKGYGTHLHRQALAEYGPCPVHRYSFAPVRRASSAS